MSEAVAKAVDYEAALTNSVREVIEMMFGLEVEGPEDIEKSDALLMTGLIGLAGAHFHGLLRIAADDTGARSLAAALLGGEEMLGEGNEMIADGLGELANMVGGSFKRLIDEGGVQIELSLPSVLEKGSNPVEIGGKQVVRKGWTVEGHPVETTLIYSED